MQAVPPFATGKKVSMTRWPVMSGIPGASFSRTGLGTRTTHFCVSVSGTEPPDVVTEPIGSRMVYVPLASFASVPRTPWGTMILWRMSGVSWTVPRIVPGTTSEPGFAVAVNSHSFASSSGAATKPRVMKSPKFFFRTSSGRWTPS